MNRRSIRIGIRIGLLTLSLALTGFALFPRPAAAWECSDAGASQWLDSGCCSSGRIRWHLFECDGTEWQPTGIFKCSLAC